MGLSFTHISHTTIYHDPYWVGIYRDVSTALTWYGCCVQLLPNTVLVENWSAHGVDIKVAAKDVQGLERRGHNVTAFPYGAVVQVRSILRLVVVNLGCNPKYLALCARESIFELMRGNGGVRCALR